MPLEISTPTLDDIPALAAGLWDAYEGKPSKRRVLRDQPVTASLEQALNNWTADFFRETWSEGHRRVARDTETGEIASSIVYEFVPTTSVEYLGQPPKTEWTKSSPEGTDAQVLEEMTLSDWRARVKVMGGKQFIYLNSMYTMRKHQRRGAAKLLINIVLREADKRNLPVFLTATPEGHSVYSQLGFEVAGTEMVDMSAIGEPPWIHYSMVRPAPRPAEAADFPELPRRPVKVVPLEATDKDARDMMDMHTKAFGPDALLDFCFSGPGIPKQPMEERVTKHLERMANPQFRYHKAVDPENPDGPMLGCSMWYWVKDPQTEPENSPWGDYPPGVHLACLDASMGELRRWRRDHFRERNQQYFYLAVLGVHPDAQRRGVGSALLRQGLKEADENGLPAFLDASPGGIGLYKKFGWEEVIENKVNLKDFGGGDVECTTVGLNRPPGAKEKAKEETKIPSGEQVVVPGA